MKRQIAILLICFALCTLTLCSCSTEAPPAPTQYTNSRYTITIQNDICYLSPVDPVEPSSCCSPKFYPDFDSVGEMRQAILQGSIVEEELNNALRNSKTADGSIQIYNIDNLYECRLAPDLSVFQVIWYGPYYTVCMRGQTANGYIVCCDYEKYARNLQEKYTDIYTRDNFTMLSQEESPDRNSTIYIFDTGVAKMKDICYTIQDGDKLLYVQEQYLLEADHDQIAPSSDVPLRVCLWGTDDSGYFYGSF